MAARARESRALEPGQASSSSPIVIPSPAASHAQQTDHRFNPYEHPSAFLKSQSYDRAAPPSFASTSSYSPSVASSSTAIAPLSLPGRAFGWGGAHREVDTCLAPSAHIWEDFYNEFKGVHMDEDGAESRSDPTSSEPQATPQSCDDMFSSFSFFAAPEPEAPVCQPVSATDGSFPCAEFLDIPSSATSQDTSMLPDLADIDFSKLDWLPDFIVPEPLPGATLQTSGASTGHRSTSSPLTSSSNELSSVMPGPGCISDSHKTGNYEHDGVAQGILSAKLNAGAPKDDEDGGACVEGNAVKSGKKHTPSNDKRRDSPIMPVTAHPDSPHQASPSTQARDQSTAMEDYPALSHVKVWATPKDREVLRFQKNVLSIATDFYIGLAALFDETDSDVIKLGMTRASMSQDMSLQDIVNEMKELCGRLMVKKNVIADSIESSNEFFSPDNTPPASEPANTANAANAAMRPPPIPQAMSPGKKRKTPGSPSTPRTPLPPSIPATPSSPARSCLFTDPNAVLATLPDPSSLPQPGKVIHGPWKTAEVDRLQGLVQISKRAEDGAPKEHVDWTWVVSNFGPSRNRHQVLIKAVELGLRETSTHYSRRVKQKSFRDVQSPKSTKAANRELPPAWPHQSPTLAPVIMPSPYPSTGSPLLDPQRRSPSTPVPAFARPSSVYLGSPQTPKGVHRRHNSSSSSTATATATRTPTHTQNGLGFSIYAQPAPHISPGGHVSPEMSRRQTHPMFPGDVGSSRMMPGIAPSVVSPTAGEFGYRIQVRSGEGSSM
ncbi:hypothetical protein B9479_001391 [Cryptococcus floricola]|uniref:Myb-like domain-containing protein n=1 Tax=Cryptococcus floricola TaxID=2591691 RepID=A0A5D3B5F3_9TREE|nr:hypothetical protein B9479_001391 [Cryptococcus floricola]